VPVLEHHNGVFLKIRHADGFPCFRNSWVLSHKEPPHVGKEEASLGIVGITDRLTALVVHPVVSAPNQNAVLPCH